MRVASLLVLLTLAGCGPGLPAWLGVEAASVTVLGRGLVDIGVSAVSGRDCSIVRLDRGETYCAPPDDPPRIPYCTRSLGVPDCWASPALLPDPPRGLADAPDPTRAQQAYREARWPKALTTLP